MATDYRWRGEFENAEVNELHAEAFGHRVLDDDWVGQVARHSLGWVCARRGDDLVGFVNVAWDGGVHAFVLDTIVAADAGRRESAPALSPARSKEHARPAASGSMSTSKTICAPSTSTRAASSRRTRA